MDCATAAPARPAASAAPTRAQATPDDVNQAVQDALDAGARESPPWEAGDTAQAPVRAAAPVRLPVRSPEDLRKKTPLAPAHTVQTAPETVAIPVRTAPEPGARLQPLPSAAPAPARLVRTEEGDVWHATVQQLIAQEAITALVRELALQSQLVARDPDHWLLRVERESLNQPTARERLRAALEAAGHARQISVEVGVVIDSPARRNAHAAAERQRVAEEIVHNDPYVQQLMRDFGAKIVPGSIKPA